MEQALRGVRAALSDMTSTSSAAPGASKAAAQGPRIGRCEAVCIMTPAHHAAYAGSVQSNARAVPEVHSVPGVAGSSEVALVYRGDNDSVSSTFRASAFLDDRASKQDVFKVSGRKALDWVLGGYNVNVFATGHAGSGKSSTLFGQSGRHGQVHVLLNELYKHIEELQQDSHSHDAKSKQEEADDGDDAEPPFTVGISMWELTKDRVTDLLVPPTGGARVADSEEATAEHLLKFVNVRAETFSTAVALLSTGMSRSANFCHSRGEDQLVRPNRAHLFLRLAVHNSHTGNLSILHVLDLIGDVPVNGGVPREPTSGPPGSVEAERDYFTTDPEFAKFSLQQATSFRQMVAELADAAVNTGETGLHTLSAHQSSALNRLVAPVLSGNAKTLILQHLSPHRFFRPDSARTLGVGQKALNINTICRQLAVPIEDMRFLDSAVVLAPNKKQSQPAPQSERKSLESKTQQPRTPPKVRETETNSGDSDGDSQSNDLLMEALYSSPTDNNDAGLKPFQSPKMTQQQREELGIFVSDDGNSGAAVSGDEDAEHAHAEANEARGGDEKDEDDALSVGSVLKQQDRENVPVDESEAAENAARTAAAEDVQSRIAYIDRILSEVQSGQQSYSAEKNRLREEFNATIDKVVGRNENAASAVVPKIPQGSDPPRFARTAEHAWRREQEAAKQARAEEAWFRQQQEVELAASVARDAARGGVHSITAPVRTASAMDGHAEENRRPDASTGSAGWGATPPSHLRPNLTKRIEPPGRGSASHGQAGSLSERDPEEVGVSAAKGAVASVYERHMEKLERISRGPPKQTARANALERRQQEPPHPITMNNTTRGHWGNQVVMPDGFVGAANADDAVPGVGLLDYAEDEHGGEDPPIRGAAYYAQLIERQRRELDEHSRREHYGYGSQHSRSLQKENHESPNRRQYLDHHFSADERTGAGSDSGRAADVESGVDAGRSEDEESEVPSPLAAGGAEYFRQKIAAHVAENEAAEAAAEYEVRIAELRGENVKLRGDLRAIKQASGFADVFRRQVHSLWRRCSCFVDGILVSCFKHSAYSVVFFHVCSLPHADTRATWKQHEKK
eukprot:INCI14784.12.p1 GENE.INCI14784.12~~INCI14784.12.p1  ORF type:complete len:1108 (+),score=208.95 INCI14784.12:79-3324(+)